MIFYTNLNVFVQSHAEAAGVQLPQKYGTAYYSSACPGEGPGRGAVGGKRVMSNPVMSGKENVLFNFKNFQHEKV